MASSNWKRKMTESQVPLSRDSHPNKLSLDLNSIVIVADVYSESDLDQAEKFANNKRNLGKSVHCLYFSKNKQLSSENLVPTKQIKWSGIPTGDLVEELLSQEFDILYTPNQSISKSLEHIIKCCKATIKTGAFNEHTVKYLDIAVEERDISFAQIFKMIDEVLDNLLRRA